MEFLRWFSRLPATQLLFHFTELSDVYRSSDHDVQAMLWESFPCQQCASGVTLYRNTWIAVSLAVLFIQNPEEKIEEPL